MQWESFFAERTKTMKRSTIREILKLTAQPDVISFAGGLPASEFFPIEHVRQATDYVLREHGQEALQYSTTEGLPALRGLIAERLSGDDFSAHPDDILIISGSQQGLDMITRLLLNDGDRMVVENPTYLGMLMASRPYQLEYVPVGSDEDGMIIDELEPLMKDTPDLVYAVPNFQNPQGTTLSLERRKQLINLLEQYPVPLLEDNPYGELRYSGEDLPSLLLLEAQKRGSHRLDGSVIYLGTFSKVLTPGLRIGYIAAAPQVIDKLVQIKQSADLHTSTLSQFIAYEVSKDGYLDRHIAKLREVYRERRDVMLDAMAENFPDGVQWSEPDGGLFLMVRMPQGIDSTELLKRALEHKVAFVPGADFHIDGTGQNTMRLNFSNAKPEQIAEGVYRLAVLLKEELVASH